MQQPIDKPRNDPGRSSAIRPAVRRRFAQRGVEEVAAASTAGLRHRYTPYEIAAILQAPVEQPAKATAPADLNRTSCRASGAALGAPRSSIQSYL